MPQVGGEEFPGAEAALAVGWDRGAQRTEVPAVFAEDAAQARAEPRARMAREQAQAFLEEAGQDDVVSRREGDVLPRQRSQPVRKAANTP